MSIISGIVKDAAGNLDSRDWTVWSPVYADGATAGVVVSTKKSRIKVDAGVFNADINPGVVALENPEGTRWNISVPSADADLWELIRVSINVPPTTSQDMLNTAVQTYITANPMSIEGGTP